MMIDFDHGMVEVERPIRVQGIYKRDVKVGHNVWIGYGACMLRGVTVGDNSVIGTSAVVTTDVPSNAVVGGYPGEADPDARRPKDVPLERLSGQSTQPASSGARLRSAGSSVASPSERRSERLRVARGALARVVARRSGRRQKRPVAGLQRQQLAQRALARPGAARERPQLGGPRLPGEVGDRRGRSTSAGRPPRPSWSRRGQLGRGRRTSWRSSASSSVVSARPCRAASLDDRAEPVHALVPPVAEQLGVERADADAAARDPLARRARRSRAACSRATCARAAAGRRRRRRCARRGGRGR